MRSLHSNASCPDFSSQICDAYKSAKLKCLLHSATSYASFFQVGDEVAKGDTLVTLEAMKMEVAVPAPSAGKVAAVRVEASTLAQQGDVLVVLVPS